MDCEGSEYESRQHQPITFSKIDRIIIEYHDGKAEEIDEDLKRMDQAGETSAATERMGIAVVQEKLSDP